MFVVSLQREEDGSPLRRSDRLASAVVGTSAACLDAATPDDALSTSTLQMPPPTPIPATTDVHIADLPDIQIELADLTDNDDTFEKTILDLIGDADESFIDSQECLNEDTYFSRESSYDELSEDSIDEDDYRNEPEEGLEDLLHAWPSELLFQPFGTRSKRRRIHQVRHKSSAQPTATPMRAQE
jgi:hypothetical protein